MIGHLGVHRPDDAEVVGETQFVAFEFEPKAAEEYARQ